MTIDQFSSVPAWTIHLLLPVAMSFRITAFLRLIKADPRSSSRYLRNTFVLHVLLLVALVAMVAILIVDWRTSAPAANDHLSLTLSLAMSWAMNFWFLRRLLSWHDNEDT